MLGERPWPWGCVMVILIFGSCSYNSLACVKEDCEVVLVIRPS